MESSFKNEDSERSGKNEAQVSELYCAIAYDVTAGAPPVKRRVI